MQDLSIPFSKKVLVGFNKSDDAGVFQISPDLALVQTVDFFTPIVDDPFTFGQITAANALSDVYAMGGIPLTAMNIVAFPLKKFNLSILKSILEGGLDILKKVKVQLLGGHSIEDPELKYGLSITGKIHPQKIIKNHGCQKGDLLILTKPLGTGIIGTAIKAGMADQKTINSFIKSMISLNDQASKIIIKHQVKTATDVTGFGLAGHLVEMISSENLEIVIEAEKIPMLPKTLDFLKNGLVPGGLWRNKEYVEKNCFLSFSVPGDKIEIAFDPQTSGGLLISASPKKASAILKEIQAEQDLQAEIIGEVKSANQPTLSFI